MLPPPAASISGRAWRLVFDQRVRRDVLGERVAVPRQLAICASEILLAREGDRVDEDIQAAPALVEVSEERFNLGRILDVARDDRNLLLGLERPGELEDVVPQPITGIGERQLSPLDDAELAKSPRRSSAGSRYP